MFEQLEPEVGIFVFGFEWGFTRAERPKCAFISENKHSENFTAIKDKALPKKKFSPSIIRGLGPAINKTHIYIYIYFFFLIN